METSNIPDMWESKRAVITALYKEEEWPLKQVIKAIQTKEFRPSERQVRARLKKWQITKPSRKRYTGHRSCPTDIERTRNKTRPRKHTKGGSASASSSTPDVRAQPEHESPPSEEMPDGPSIPEAVLSQAVPDDYPSLGFHGVFSPSVNSCRWSHTSSEPAGVIPSNALSFAADENNKLDGLSTRDRLHPGVDKKTTPSNKSAPYSNPPMEDQLRSTLGRHGTPRNVQQGRRKLPLSTTGQPRCYKPRDPLSDPFYASYFSPRPHFTPQVHEGQHFCLACRDFSRL